MCTFLVLAFVDLSTALFCGNCNSNESFLCLLNRRHDLSGLALILINPCMVKNDTSISTFKQEHHILISTIRNLEMYTFIKLTGCVCMYVCVCVYQFTCLTISPSP